MGSNFHLVAHLRRPFIVSRAERVKIKAHLQASTGKLVLGKKALSFSLSVLIAFTCLAYVTLINIRVTKGFEIKDLETKVNELQKTQKQLERQAADLQSIQNIEKKLNMSGFVPTTNVTYLRPDDYALVQDQALTP